jgi:endo-1,4-beta-xylanase
VLRPSLPCARTLAALTFTLALAPLAFVIHVGCVDMAPAAPPTPTLAAASSGSSAAAPPTLRAAGARVRRRVGTAMVTWHFDDPNYRAAAAQHFDSLTPENEMKWDATEPHPGGFEFEGGDRLVAFAVEHGMRVRGHTLVWHNQLPAWAKSLSGGDLHAAMLRHITGVVGHYKGRIAQWDVVNESIAEGESGALREASPFTALGPTYLDDAFRAAHAADPEALLFYNDYDIEAPGTGKSEAAYRLVKRLKDGGVPIHGIGFQMHVDPRSLPPGDAVRTNFERFAALGLLIEITELDVPLGEIPGSREEKLQRQKVITRDLVGACVAVAQCSGITFWGVTDRYSWLNTPEWGPLRGRPPHDPLPLDADYAPKPMYSGALEALGSR